MRSWTDVLEQGSWALFSRSPTAELLPSEGFVSSSIFYNNFRIIGSLVFVWFLYLGFLHLVFRSFTWKVKNLMVSNTHAILAVFLCIWALRRDSLIFASPNTPSSALTLQVSFSYFLYDFFFSELMGLEDRLTAFHHFISLSSIGIGLWTGHSGSELLHALIFMESSNPCLHTRGILREVSPDSTHFLKGVELLFVLVYFLARIVFGPYLLYLLWVSNTPFPMKIAGLAIVSLSFYWFHLILTRLLSKYFPGLSRGKKSSTKQNEEKGKRKSS